MTLTNAELIGLVSNKTLDAEAFNTAKAELIRRIELRETNKDGEAEKLRAELRAAQEVNKKLQDSLDVVTFDFKVSSEQMFAWKHDASHLRERISELEANRAELRAEREVCALLCEEEADSWAQTYRNSNLEGQFRGVAARIRKRSEVHFAPE